MNKIRKLYSNLLKEYGPQGWWPVNGRYNHKDYSIPQTDKERFEICVGAILTQNTSWKNVEKSLSNLRLNNMLNPNSILTCSNLKLSLLIKPSGYFNQKSKKLKLFAEFYLKQKNKIPSREQLLGVWGIGKETADSILCYGYKQNVFVVDAYTRRIFFRLNLISEEKTEYDEIRAIVESSLRSYAEINEFHALLVEHAKRHCTKAKSSCTGCPFTDCLSGI